MAINDSVARDAKAGRDKLRSLAREAIRCAIAMPGEPRAREALEEFQRAADPLTILELVTEYENTVQLFAMVNSVSDSLLGAPGSSTRKP